MKKILSLFIALCAFLIVPEDSAYAQTSQNQKYYYIFVGLEGFGSIRIYKGDGVVNKATPSYLVVGEDNKKLQLGDDVAAANYMVQKGWELVTRDIMRKPVENYDWKTIEALFDNLKLKRQ